MRAYFRIFTGVRFHTTVQLRSRASERLAVLVLSILVLGGGLWPQPGVASRYHAADALMRLRSEAQDHAPAIEVKEAESESNEKESAEEADPRQAQMDSSGEAARLAHRISHNVALKNRLPSQRELMHSSEREPPCGKLVTCFFSSSSWTSNV
jgi:hypothetical protein